MPIREMSALLHSWCCHVACLRCCQTTSFSVQNHLHQIWRAGAWSVIVWHQWPEKGGLRPFGSSINQDHKNHKKHWFHCDLFSYLTLDVIVCILCVVGHCKGLIFDWRLISVLQEYLASKRLFLLFFLGYKQKPPQQRFGYWLQLKSSLLFELTIHCPTKWKTLLFY